MNEVERREERVMLRLLRAKERDADAEPEPFIMPSMPAKLRDLRCRVGVLGSEKASRDSSCSKELSFMIASFSGVISGNP